MQPQHNLKSFLAVLTILIVPAAILAAYFRNVSPEGGGHGGGAAAVSGNDGGMGSAKAGGGGHAGMGSGAMPPSPGGHAPSDTGGDTDMSKMTQGARKPSPQELYPALVSLSDLTPEQREQVRGRADEQMRSGAAMLGEGLARLSEAAEKQDYAAMQEAAVAMREAFTRFERGLAARRALADGEPPSQAAPQSFNGDMKFLLSRGIEVRAGLSGFAPFNFFTMVLPIAFALAMVAMYLFERRRCAALLERISTDSGSPPPGSAPPLAPAPATDANAAMPEVMQA